jgi:Spy/CpxP family protein refolding chaperone
MTKNRLAVIVGLTAVLAAAAAAQGRGGPGAMGGRGAAGGLFQDLSADQRAAIREIILEHQKEMITLRAEMETKGLELQELIRAEAGEAAVMAKVEELGALRTEMMKKRVALQLEIRAQLTAEQKDAFDEMPMMMGGRMGGGAGWGMGGFGGPGPGGDID